MSPKLRSLTMIGLVLYGTSAIAAPPTITDKPIVAKLGTDSVIVNLRAQGVISGTAPLVVKSGQVRVNKRPSDAVGVQQVPASGGGGVVCLRFEGPNIQSGDVVDIDLTVSNLLGETSVKGVRIEQKPGPKVDPAACLDPNSSPTANAGADQSLADTDGQAGENVVLNGAAASDPDGTISSYVWTDSRGIQIATGATPTLSLPDGISEITLIVTDDSGDKATNTARDTVAITIAGTQTPTADAGANQSIPDSDNIPGESVRLDGSASSDPDGSIVSYEWFDGQDNLLGSGAILDDVTLPDGDNRIVLVVRDNVGNTASDQVTITVDAAPTRPTLTSLQGLTPTQESMARALDDLCVRLAKRARQQPLTEDESDLLGRCDGIIFDDVPVQQIEAIDELGAQDLNAVRTQALLFSQLQYAGIMDRLIALRDGAHGLNLEKLTLSIDGKTVPLAVLESVARNVLGGGASADEQEPGGLLADRWGIWASGNFSFGGKDSSAADQGFNADQWGFTAGVDYRLSDKVVLGAAIGFGQSDISFNPSGEGGLDASAWTASGYASAYPADNFYVDGIFNYSRVDYDAERHILYEDATGTVDRTARGSTDGSNLSAGLAFGYDFVLGGLTISPNAGFFYIDATVDPFQENGASGLDLAYDERNFESATGNAGLRVAYAWNLGWGVLLPQFRGVFVREFQDEVEVFGVRFANDPFADAANPTPPIVVHAESPDQSYWRFALGLAAQFKYGVSGYAEYQRLEGFESIDFEDITFGLSFQRSF
jgi:outer membrane autotransporter protein